MATKHTHEPTAYSKAKEESCQEVSQEEEWRQEMTFHCVNCGQVYQTKPTNQSPQGQDCQCGCGSESIV